MERERRERKITTRSPCHAMPYHGMPCHAMPYHTISRHYRCHAMPCHTMHLGITISQTICSRSHAPLNSSGAGARQLKPIATEETAQTDHNRGNRRRSWQPSIPELKATTTKETVEAINPGTRSNCHQGSRRNRIIAAPDLKDWCPENASRCQACADH